MSANRQTERLRVETTRRNEMVEITDQVARLANKFDVEDGYVLVYVPHTTAGVTIQENADPDVKHDLLAKLEQLVPHKEAFYRHAEGNSDSHLKAVLVGSSQHVLIEQRRLVLGQWQGIYLCEFDGPRRREIICKFVDLSRSPRGRTD